VEGAYVPKLRPDVAVFKSTYGDRLHASRDIEEERLIAKIASTTSAGGKLLIPAFSLGRSQEIIPMINRAINKLIKVNEDITENNIKLEVFK
jgi:Cft2 family RNA processing exonuclease